LNSKFNYAISDEMYFEKRDANRLKECGAIISLP
jgi:hypothetical protein